MQQLGRVELPMATPYIMSGIRIAAVGAVGTMTIAAFAGANGLGWFIMPVSYTHLDVYKRQFQSTGAAPYGGKLPGSPAASPPA